MGAVQKIGEKEKKKPFQVIILRACFMQWRFPSKLLHQKPEDDGNRQQDEQIRLTTDMGESKAKVYTPVSGAEQ